MKITKLKLKLFLIVLFFALYLNNSSYSQDSQVIKKIIIDDNIDSGRLLSPPTENKKDIIKLIPPKSIIGEEAIEEDIKKEKALEIQKKKEIEVQRKAEEKKQKELEQQKKAEENKQKELEQQK